MYGRRTLWKRSFSKTTTPRYSDDFPARVFLKHNSKMTSDCCAFNVLRRSENRKKLMRFQGETSVFKFLWLLCADGASASLTCVTETSTKEAFFFVLVFTQSFRSSYDLGRYSVLRHLLTSHYYHFRLLQGRFYHKTRLTRSCKYGLLCNDKWLVDKRDCVI